MNPNFNLLTISLEEKKSEDIDSYMDEKPTSINYSNARGNIR